MVDEGGFAGYDGDVWLKFEVNDGWVCNFSDSLRFRVDNNNLPSVSIVEITTEQSDSDRIRYVLRDDERDTLRIRLEYSEDGEVWKVCSVYGDGTFATKVDYEVGSYPRDIAFGDIDGDGDSG